MHDPILDLVFKLHNLGRQPEAIARRVAKTPGWVREVINDASIAERIGQSNEPLVDDGEEIWNAETKRIKQEFLVPKCFRVWNQILDDPDAKHSDKLKAAEAIMKYDTNLVDNTKEDPEKITNIVMTDEQFERYIRLERELSG